MTISRIPSVEGGIQPTLLTTTGDIMYASSASNPARLGIGSSAQVLTVASGIPSWATAAASFAVQVVNSQTGTVATCSTLLPNDGTIPQNTEGTQVLSVAITPNSASNLLVVWVNTCFTQSASNGGDIGTAIFQDSVASALAATANRTGVSTPGTSNLIFYKVAGTTSATTFKVRMGCADVGSWTFATNSYGNITGCSLTVMEITA